MKRFTLLLLLTCCIAMCYAQTENSLREYFKNNILELDPIEGIYDCQVTMKYVTPYVNQTHTDDPTKFFIKETYRGSGRFEIYELYEGWYFFKHDSNKIRKIGETSAYYYSFMSSQARFVMDGSSYFRAVVPLDHASAKEATDNPNLRSMIKVTLIYECIKTYPTSSMYQAAAQEEARKREQEYQRALEEAQKRAGWSGSGFALNQGHVVTNYHVVEEAKTILIKGVNGDFQTELKAKVVATDKVNDIAILQIDDERFQGFGTIPYKIKRNMSDVGESVWTLGYPMTDVMGEEVKFTDGRISSRTGIQGDVSVYQISVPIQPGNSGGALFDDNGTIVGITSSGLNREAFNSENVNYAIKTSYLYNLIECAMSTSIIPQGTAMQGQPLTQKITLAKNFVFLIKCSTAETKGEETQLSIEESQTPAGNESPRVPIIKSPAKKTITNPSVSTNESGLIVNSVIITDNYTAIEIRSKFTNYEWCNIHKATYIVCDGRMFSLINTEGINIAPDKTYYKNQDIQFTLYFDPIPVGSKLINLIEPGDSSWKIHGINLK